jgi:hypothetical protein
VEELKGSDSTTAKGSSGRTPELFKSWLQQIHYTKRPRTRFRVGMIVRSPPTRPHLPHPVLPSSLGRIPMIFSG